MRTLSKEGIDLIKHFEGLSLKPYLDSVGVATIGYGTTRYPDGRSVSINDPVISGDQAEDLMINDANKRLTSIEGMLQVPVNDNELAALVSLAYNIGLSALQKSTLLRLLNTGSERQAVADQFLRWNKAGGKELAGLTRRRQAERSLFVQPVIQSSQLPEIPSDDELAKKLKDIEDDIMNK